MSILEFWQSPNLKQMIEEDQNGIDEAVLSVISNTRTVDQNQYKKVCPRFKYFKYYIK